jgi:hypothetical protein
VGAAVGSASGNAGKGALIGAGIGAVGGALLKANEASQRNRAREEQYYYDGPQQPPQPVHFQNVSPAQHIQTQSAISDTGLPQGAKVKKKVVRKYDADGNVISEEEVPN